MSREPPGSTERYTRWVNQLEPHQLLAQVFPPRLGAGQGFPEAADLVPRARASPALQPPCCLPPGHRPRPWRRDSVSEEPSQEGVGATGGHRGPASGAGVPGHRPRWTEQEGKGGPGAEPSHCRGGTWKPPGGWAAWEKARGGAAGLRCRGPKSMGHQVSPSLGSPGTQGANQYVVGMVVGTQSWTSTLSSPTHESRLVSSPTTPWTNLPKTGPRQPGRGLQQVAVPFASLGPWLLADGRLPTLRLLVGQALLRPTHPPVQGPGQREGVVSSRPQARPGSGSRRPHP